MIDIVIKTKAGEIKFEPQPDITVLELAEIVAIFAVGQVKFHPSGETLFGELSDGAKRHFAITEKAAGA